MFESLSSRHLASIFINFLFSFSSVSVALIIISIIIMHAFMQPTHLTLLMMMKRNNSKLKRDKFLIKNKLLLARKLINIFIKHINITLRASIQLTSLPPPFHYLYIALNACRLRRRFCCPSSSQLL